MNFFHRRGMTLIELLFGLAILGIVAVGIAQVLNIHLRHFRSLQSVVDQRQNIRLGLATLTRELRGAGYGILLKDPGRLTGTPPCHPWSGKRPVHVETHRIEFLSNLHGVQTVLTHRAQPGDTTLRIPTNRRIRDQALSVSMGSAFDRRDIVYLYRLDPDRPDIVQVECHTLALPGVSGRIRLGPSGAVRSPFPAGSPVHVINSLRYTFDPDRNIVMRWVDGTAAVLSESIEALTFQESGSHVFIRMAVKHPGQGFLNQSERWQETSVFLLNQ